MKSTFKVKREDLEKISENKNANPIFREILSENKGQKIKIHSSLKEIYNSLVQKYNGFVDYLFWDDCEDRIKKIPLVK